MDEMERFNKFVPVKDEDRVPLLLLYYSWHLQIIGYLVILWSIFCLTCFGTITKRILTALVGVALVLLGIQSRKTKKWAIFIFLILEVIVALFLIIRARIMLNMIRSVK
jgi:hypothetical protein